MKLLIIASFSDFPMYFWSLLRAFSCIAALEHSTEICSLNFNHDHQYLCLVIILSLFIVTMVCCFNFLIINNQFMCCLRFPISNNSMECIWIYYHFVFSEPSPWEFSFKLQIFIRSANLWQTSVIVLSSSSKFCKSVF